VGEHTAFVAQEPAKRDRAMGEKQIAKEEKKSEVTKVIEVDLDSDDENRWLEEPQ
jgi:hypothetical protein